MGKWTRVACGLLALATVLWACDEWAIWDDLFKREEVGNTARGWTGGDGAISAQLPGGRVFWIFGDTWLTSYTDDTRPELGDPNHWIRLAHATFGNTIAV